MTPSQASPLPGQGTGKVRIKGTRYPSPFTHTLKGDTLKRGTHPNVTKPWGTLLLRQSTGKKGNKGTTLYLKKIYTLSVPRPLTHTLKQAPHCDHARTRTPLQWPPAGPQRNSNGMVYVPYASDLWHPMLWCHGIQQMPPFQSISAIGRIVLWHKSNSSSPPLAGFGRFGPPYARTVLGFCRPHKSYRST